MILTRTLNQFCIVHCRHRVASRKNEWGTIYRLNWTQNVWKKRSSGEKSPSTATASLRKVVKGKKLFQWVKILFQKLYSNRTSFPRKGDSQSEEIFQLERLTCPVETTGMTKAIKRINNRLECREFFWGNNEFADKEQKAYKKKCWRMKLKPTKKEQNLRSIKLLKAN